MDGDSDKIQALSSVITIPFHTAKEAEIAWNTLRVDKEPPRGGCTKTMQVKDGCLVVNFTATEPKKLRVGINAFFDSVALIVETIEQFGPPAAT